MKTTPTETDREAGQMFVPWPAMRVMWTATSRRWERVADGTAHTGHPFAIDTDDPATVGVMLAQVEQLAILDDIMDRWPYVVGGDRWMLIATVHETQGTLDRLFAPTLGALLVAAKRALAEAPK